MQATNDDEIPKEIVDALLLHGIETKIRGDIPRSNSCPNKNMNMPPRKCVHCVECGAVWVLVGHWNHI